MTDISIKIESIYDVDTCEHALETNKWIRNSIEKAGIKAEKYIYDFSFDIGDLHYSCDDEAEFKQHAFGQPITINHHKLSIFTELGDILFFAVSPKWIDEKNLYIASKNKNDLVAVVDALNEERLVRKNLLGSIKSVNINVEGSQVGAISVGDNNVIGTKTLNTPEEKETTFWGGVWQTVTSNIVWAILISAVLFVLAYLGIAQPDWMALQ